MGEEVQASMLSPGCHPPITSLCPVIQMLPCNSVLWAFVKNALYRPIANGLGGETSHCVYSDTGPLPGALLPTVGWIFSVLQRPRHYRLNPWSGAAGMWKKL